MIVILVLTVMEPAVVQAAQKSFYSPLSPSINIWLSLSLQTTTLSCAPAAPRLY